MAFKSSKPAGKAASKPTGALGGIKINKAAFTKGNEAYKSGGNDGDFPDSAELDPGVYSCILVGGRGIEVNDEPKIVFDFLVGDNEITDDSAGKQVSLWFGLSADSDEGKKPPIVWLYKFLSSINYDADDMTPEKLEEILEDIKENPKGVQLQAKTSKGYVNLRLKKLLEGIDLTDILSTYEGAAGAEKEEEVDFSEMTRDELKAYIAENKLKILVVKTMTDAVIVKKIKELTK